ncbi:cache domain-containing sensor histidine kinase [Cohnella hongkongensis]|uniref:histidine kinase n=1 Tax=Cohnella hongkongensis TaxID=178337 RepID=A0ABV9F6Q5_9BACL
MRLTLQRFFRYFFYNMKMKYKLLLAFLLLTTLPLALFQFLTAGKISQIITRHIEFSAEQGFDQTYSFLSYKMTRIVNLSDVIMAAYVSKSDKNVYEILLRSANDYEINEQLEDMNYLTQYLNSFQDGLDVSRARLYVQKSFLYAQQNVNLFSFQDALDTPWYKRLVAEDGKLLWCPPIYFASENNKTPILSLARLIRNPEDYSKIIGILRFDLEEHLIQSILSRANTIRDSQTFLLNKENILLSASDMTRLIEMPMWTARPDGSLQMKESLDSLSHSHLVLSKPIDNSDWTIMTTIPLTRIHDEKNKLQVELLLLVIGISMIAYSAAYLLSNTITRRLSNLNDLMNYIQNGSLDTIAKFQGKDEIGKLSETYNYMLSKITIMHQEQYELGLEMKNTELKALQSQINPHFLYNTLDLLNWMAQQNRTSDIEKTVKALARFYRLTLSNGRDIVPIRDELEQISLYVQIQNTRFYHQIRLTVDVDEAIYPYEIPKITLQPIVENSIIHGILGKPKKEGEIRIIGKMKNQAITIEIQDDGIGMSPEHIDGMRRRLSDRETSGSGYGVKNVNERLRLYFGEETCGVEYRSEPGHGTSVVIRIPARRVPDSDDIVG